MDEPPAGGERTSKAISADRGVEADDVREVYRAILDALPDQIAVIDHAGVITYINEAWKKFARENGDPDLAMSGVGVNYSNVSLASQGESLEGSLTATDGILSVLHGTTDYFESEYPCFTEAEELWFVMRVTPLNDCQPRNVVTAHNNITRHKRAAADQAEAKWRDEQARERVSLEKFSGRRPTAVTAQSFGLQPLRDVAPHLFQEWVNRYLAVVEQPVAQRTYQEDHDISGELRSIAEQLSFLKAGPRDIVDFHITALQRVIAQHNQVHTHAEEARLLILELIENLVAIYRNTSLENSASLRSLGG